MFDDVTFINIGNDSVYEGGDFVVAVRDLSQGDFEKMEKWILASVETMTAYDSMEEVVSDVLDRCGLVYEIICPDRFITVE